MGDWEKGNGWTRERDEALRVMAASKMSTRAIGNALGLSHVIIVRRIKALGLRSEEQPSSAARPNHIADYKRARRGFHVPAHLEAEYYELLKTGVPIAEACRRLGIARQNEDRGA